VKNPVIKLPEQDLPDLEEWKGFRFAFKNWADLDRKANG